MNFLAEAGSQAWSLFLDAALYMLFGIFVGALIKMFLTPESVAKHLAHGRVKSVFKAALFGVPLPLCSCGVLPAGASLKRQGANNGATTAFLIATPESGVDSMAITYALLDPLMTVIRPIAAMCTAITAGLTENFFGGPSEGARPKPDLTCPVDGCCDGLNCPPDVHRRHHGWVERFNSALKYAFGDLWGDIAPWFFLGLALSGVIAAWVPEDALASVIGGGLQAMLIMLVIGVPLYICATASTPIAAALILKGVSPGAALVFLLVGPATNITSLTVLIKVLGRRGVVIYLTTLAACAIGFGFAVDGVYAWLGMSAQAIAGQAAAAVPPWLEWMAAVILLGISAPSLWNWLNSSFRKPSDTCDAACCRAED